MASAGEHFETVKIFNVKKKKKLIQFYGEKPRWSCAELHYAWCDWQLELKLFIIQYGSLRADAREREGAEEWVDIQYSAVCSGNVILFYLFATSSTLIRLDISY